MRQTDRGVVGRGVVGCGRRRPGRRRPGRARPRALLGWSLTAKPGRAGSHSFDAPRTAHPPPRAALVLGSVPASLGPKSPVLTITSWRLGCHDSRAGRRFACGKCLAVKTRGTDAGLHAASACPSRPRRAPVAMPPVLGRRENALRGTDPKPAKSSVALTAGGAGSYHPLLRRAGRAPASSSGSRSPNEDANRLPPHRGASQWRRTREMCAHLELARAAWPPQDETRAAGHIGPPAFLMPNDPCGTIRHRDERAARPSDDPIARPAALSCSEPRTQPNGSHH
jgi:hypothetical protein